MWSCSNEKDREENFYCDAEHTLKDSVLTDAGNKFYFQGIKQRVEKFPKSGKYSLIVNKKMPFAFTTKVKLSAGTTYRLSFWQYGKSDKVFAVAQVADKFYENSNKVIEKDSSGHKKIGLIFQLPEKLKDEIVSLYVWNAGEDTVYVDDFRLEYFSPADASITPKDSLFWIYINDKNFRKISRERSEALKRGVLVTGDNSWVKGIVLWADKDFKVKLRLKGDWTDHLQGKKWSFRIKIRNNASFKGMMVFSVQNPKTRHFLDQWLLYNVFREEGLLAPRYGFIYSQVNDNFVGLYAYEEHFRKQLVESQKRREGPILKNTEDAFWDVVIAKKKDSTVSYYPLYEASKIVPFALGKTVKSGVLFQEFNIAKNLLYQHKWGKAPVSDIFDVKKAAQFFALINVMQGWHGLRWHNQRYYYNPITSKLEYIPYDNFIDNGVYNLIGDRVIFGDFTSKAIPQRNEVILNYYLFKDSIFVDYYIKYLKKYSSDSFWDTIFSKFANSLDRYQQMLLEEFPNAGFSKDLYYKNAKKIRDALPQYISKVNNGLYDSLRLPYVGLNEYQKKAVPAFIKDYVKVYTQSVISDSVFLKVINYYPEGLDIVSFETKKKRYKIKPVKISGYITGGNDTVIGFTTSKKIKYLELSDGQNTVKVEVLPWSEPVARSPRQELEHNNKFPNEPYYTVKGNTVTFEGKQKISSIIFIPSGYKVVFKPGTDIDFVDGGGLLSYSSVYVEGLPSKKIKIYSSDKTARGFTILQADSVVLKNVDFKGLNTFDYKGWTLSGAVTVYESRVYIYNSSFTDNVCEDDLNLVRTNFVIKKSYFANTFSDGFDSDFSNGTISYSIFKNLGNDALDFSTSHIDVINCKIYSASDKGISGGEASVVKVKNCVINGANIGIASKDKSVLKVSNTQIKDVTYVFTVFQKKPEYGPAKIIANNVKSGDYIQFSLVEKRSEFILNGVKIPGTVKNVAKRFY